MTKKEQHRKKEEISIVLTGQSASMLFKKKERHLSCNELLNKRCLFLFMRRKNHAISCCTFANLYIKYINTFINQVK